MKRLTRLNRLLAVALLVLGAAALTTGALAGNKRGAVVKLRQSSVGRILADSHGKTLYLFGHDRRRQSSCYGKCARNWPPFITHGKPRAIAGARRALLGTTHRRDGRMQVTYRGHPLYHFKGDTRPGQTAGAGLIAFGGRWDPVSAAGTAARRRPMMAPRFKRPKLRHGVLEIEGTAASDRIALRLKAGDPDILQVDVGDDGSANFSFKRKHVARIVVAARAGNDLVRIDESNGIFTDSIPTTIDGGDGNDNLAGGSGAETLLGGSGNDTIDGNKGNDRALLGPDDDTFVWDPGDGSDVVEGQDGADTMRFNGADIAEQFTLSANGSRLKLFRDVGNVTMDTAGVERVDLNTLGAPDLVTVNDLSGTEVQAVNVDEASTLGGTAGDGQTDRVVVNGTARNDSIKISGDASAVAVSGLRALVAIRHHEPTDALAVNGSSGNDTIDASGLAAGVISLTLDGEAGNDTIAGGQGIETLLGGDGNDTIDGNKGNDRALMGAGDDTFVWDPGDGSDVVEGQDGADTMRFNGADIAEQFTLSANGSRLKLFRDIGNVTMDTAGVERVDLNALRGTDVVTANDLSGTDVSSVNVDLAAALGGAAGDGAVDRVVINGPKPGNERITVSGDASAVAVSGLRALVAIRHHEPTDALDVNGSGGNDTIDASGLAAGVISLTLDGGAGNDTIAGSQGIETLLGGFGNDVIDGNKGNDLALLGPDDDLFVWDPGDGSDVVEGQDGADTMRFNGADIAEQFTLSANGSRLRLFRDIGNVTMDTAGVERVDLNALRGADVVTTNDLSGTDVASVNVDLSAALGGATGDGSVDRVVVNGTPEDDRISVSGDAAGVRASVNGLPPTIAIFHPEPNDRLEVNTLDGNDAVDSTRLAAGTIQLVVDGALH